MASTTTTSALPLAETNPNIIDFSQPRQHQYHHQHRSTTAAKDMSGSALSALVSSDAMWKGGDAGTAEDDDDDDDVSLEVPDFHYRWISEEEKDKLRKDVHRSKSPSTSGSTTTAAAAAALPTTSKPGSLASLGRPSGPARSYSHSSVNDGSHHTPPQYGRSLQTGSAQSSSSSNRIASLTDASTASASSMVPTPPYASSHHSRNSLSVHGSGGSNDSGGNRPAGRTYSSRPFQRHVSAPMARDRLSTADQHTHSKDSDELSMSTTTGHTHTATVRPVLTQTTSASSVHDAAAGLASSATKNTFVTPGMKDRGYIPRTAGSTARRVIPGGLARFGGPARRITAAEAEALAEEEQAGPVLMPSPPRPDPATPPQAGPSKLPSHSPEPQAQPQHVRRRSPPMRRRHDPAPAIPEIVEYLEPDAHEDHRQRSTSPAVMERQHEEQRPRQPLRAYHSENLPSTSAASGSGSSRGGERKTDRSALAEPSRAPSQSQSNHRSPDSPPRLPHRDPPMRQPAYEPPARPAPAPPRQPAPLPLENEVRSQNQTAPLPAAAEQTRQAPAMTTTEISNNKRFFEVNGTYYERVGLLGRGGSSKVFSVLCPVKRTVFALKRVTLDRADHETFQSYTNEIELLKRLRGHDRIIQLVDHQMTYSPSNRPKVLLMVMECGEIDFAMLLDEQRGKPLNFNFVGLYWQQMLEAVQAVHQENVVHTDLKPANFVLVKGRLKIIDFGIAKAIANDTVNIQRDQQIGTVNYMSPEAISKMTNLNVLKLSYPSDVWSLGCILYQMVYGSPPFQHISGGPLSKMNYIADANHTIEYPTHAVPRGSTGLQGQAVDAKTLEVRVMPSAIDTMRSCLAYNKDNRLTIPQLLEHEFLQPRLEGPQMPQGSTMISREQMAIMVNYVLESRNSGRPMAHLDLAHDLFGQLAAQNGQPQD